MEKLLQLFILLPLITFVLSLLIPPKSEKIMANLVIGMVGLHLIGTVTVALLWLLNNQQVLDTRELNLYQSNEIDIFIGFFYDKTTAVFSIVGSLLVLLVAQFSRFYMHRDEGFKRYFNTLLLFFLGYNMAVFSSNFETLFTGWEILGICSFLLIAFYRDRYLPVKNALKVISLYRFGDICLILAMWMSHHFWHKNITFLQLSDTSVLNDHLVAHRESALFIAVMIVLAAAVKSAQMPFSSWLPRAMEGPTTSSAIFYGSLSVHLGVFLLIRTFPFWENLWIIKVIIITIGVATLLISNNIAQVQSSVKTQIAYSSITQIGFMFIEVALGFHTFALFHFAGNAFLRTYQLLVSPSVLGYLIHDQFFSYTPPQYSDDNSMWRKLKNTVYLLSLKEWNLDRLHYRLMWSPFKWVGRKLTFLSHTVVIGLLGLIYVFGLYAHLYMRDSSESILQYFPYIFSFIGLILILKAFSGRGYAVSIWLEIVSAQLFITFSLVLYNENFATKEMIIYLSGIIVSAILGYGVLKKTETIDNNIELNQFHGYAYEQPRLNFLFLVAVLGIAGLPFTPTYIGIDLIFSNIGQYEIGLLAMTTLSFLFIELSLLRIYARVFLGQHKKANHPIAYRSS
jgi:NADH-quinone oxidoreductase subunit L